MAKVWSFNTTIRNPERMESMLRALCELEGVEFDSRGQEAFFGLQIKKRLYRPERGTLEEQDLINAVYDQTSADDLDDVLVERILAKWRNRNFDGAGRGRATAGILNRFGLCVALQSKGPVVITPLAKRWLAHEIEDDELFTKFLLKWQYPNKIEVGYDDFNIKPFVGVLQLISSVNRKWSLLGHKPVGLSKDEYRLFVPALAKSSQIESYAERIISYRARKESITGTAKSNFIKEFSTNRVVEIFGTNSSIDKRLSDLRDYGDSSIRYFRMSGLIALRGEDTHIDVAKDKQVEVESVFASVQPQASHFESYDAYFTYLNNEHALELPWMNENDLIKISTELSGIVKAEAGEENLTQYLSEIEGLSTKKKVDSLEAKLNELRIRKLRDLKHNTTVLDESITKLESITKRNYEVTTARPSLDLEWYVSRALMVLNDAISIAPSFNIGDDGIPTGFRPNVSDIECYYKSFGMTVEVTLLLGRDQWYAEGQPVMQHLRDFEDRLNLDKAYCLFIAPLIHRGSLNTFWVSNTAGYEGAKQVIIPLTIGQFVDVLKAARRKIAAGGLTHHTLHQLLESISNSIEKTQNSQDWVTNIQALIEQWSHNSN